ncbi:MAG TPA: pyridoxamine 5'-phosphate oxidase family protein [Solirubrobacteraceae bacterium]|nr:pyridoxamine 5'-phosphate oxidase family protein [Solirubrobacteraceae bacterium]
MSRRDQIKMTDDEVVAFLGEQRCVTCATNGRDGWPHLMPLWYVVRDAGAASPSAGGPELWAWTYAASQKVRNLERDPRATLQVEAGEEYQLLRGVMLKTDAIIHRETADVAALGLEIFTRHSALGRELAPEVRQMVEAQARKRVALQFVERERATWDHRKLGGAY